MSFIQKFHVFITASMPESSQPNAVEQMSDFAEGENKLRKISDDLRELVPLNAILPSEQITFPTIGEVLYLP